jgi:hypothetical protein
MRAAELTREWHLEATDVGCRVATPEQLEQISRLAGCCGVRIRPDKTFTAAEASRFLTALRRRMVRF